MKLHQNKQLYIDAINFTAQQLNIPPIYVEKDYWVTYALYQIFHNAIGEQVVFKGGTALSKCYGLIERFSEDIDLVVIRAENETDSQLKKKIKNITKLVDEIMPETEVDGVTHKVGMIRKTGHSYPKLFKGDFGQVRDVIIVEATWLGYFEPYSTKTISSYIYDMMLATGQQKIADEYGLLPFKVQVLDTRRTICEKIMSLVRFSYGENPIEDLQKKVRHTYDLHQLLQRNEFLDFLKSDDFEKMILRVAQDDVTSFKNNNQWLIHHPNESLFFSDLEMVWSQVKKSYMGTFKDLVYGTLPDETLVLKTLKVIKERLKRISWKINLDT
ncbi:MAG: nucleotidyl transferase AbiEii/AbiGii toxin family protein [Salinivirgaceae bacterium]|jgi:hypothetical protein|nr:nucleotidyl transferase AbiEii/AbiGii toxin family protein [Salinivirgaceae bacterium]